MLNNWNSITKQIPYSFEGKQININSTSFYTGWVNFLDENGLWKPINSEFVKVGDGFEMKNAPFRVKAPLYADDYAIFYNNNRYDIFDKEIINDEPFEMRIKPLDIKHVEGRVIKNSLTMWNGKFENVNYVIYEKAFGDYGDLIYYIDFGKAPRLCKLVKLNKKPKVNNFKFNISYNFFPEVYKKGSNTKEFKEKKVIQFKEGDFISIGKEGSTTRGSGLKPLKIWDSGELENKKIKGVKTVFQYEKDNDFILTKTIKDNFFDNVIYPVYTDGSFTFNPDASPESTCCDGHVYTSQKASWGDAHDAVNGDLVVDDGIAAVPTSISQYVGSQKFSIYRASFGFNTASLSGKTITSASFAVYSLSKSDTDDDGQDYIRVVQSTLATATEIVVEDFDGFGTTAGSSDLDLGDANTSAVNTFTLNATGKGWINQSGITQIGLREGHDIEDAQIGLYKNNQLDARTADQGSYAKPTLTVDTPVTTGGLITLAPNI